MQQSSTLAALLLASVSLASLPAPACARDAAQDSKEGAAAPAEQAVDSAVAKVRAFIDAQKIDKTKSDWRTTLPFPELEPGFSKDMDYFWVLDTNKGKIEVRFYPEYAPIHVTSTIYLTELGFYDGITFHRVIPGFMAQGGCPLGRGTGGPGYKYQGEFSPKARHSKPGILSMANAGPGTDGSQFFLTFVPTPHLDDKHTVFGEVASGMDTMKKLEAQGTSPSGATLERLVIEKASIAVRPKPAAAEKATTGGV
jgi:cyclophilin family peptidyl-prolyl cis-trans isomerase